MKSLVVHYKNKYPNCKVEFSENSLDVFSKAGEHLVALRKNGAGQLVDCSKDYGCLEDHSLSPIPRQACAYKVHKDGSIGKDEKHDERKEWSKKHSLKSYGYHKVPSIKAIIDAVEGNNQNIKAEEVKDISEQDIKEMKDRKYQLEKR